MAKTFFVRTSPEVIKDACSMEVDDFIKKYTETTYSNADVLSKAHAEIRLTHQVKEPLAQVKEVTFKVIKTDKKVKAIKTPPKPIVYEAPEELTDEEKAELLELEKAEIALEQSVMEIADTVEEENELKRGELNEELTAEEIDDTDEDEIPHGMYLIEPNVLKNVEVNDRTNPLINAARGRDESGINEDELKKPSSSKSNRGRPFHENSQERDNRIIELLQAKKKGVEIISIMKEEGYTVHAPQITKLKAELNNKKDD